MQERNQMIEADAIELENWCTAAEIVVGILKEEPTDLSITKTGVQCERLEPWVRSQGVEPLENGINKLRDFAREYARSKDHEGVIEDLAVQYASMFYGVGAHPVFLVESVHLGKEHSLYEKPYFQVKEQYEQWEYGGIEGYSEPLDHISQEVAFMSFLVGQAASSLRAMDFVSYQAFMVAAINFAQSHLGRWLPEVETGLLSRSCSAYYQGAVVLLTGLVDLLMGYVIAA